MVRISEILKVQPKTTQARPVPIQSPATARSPFSPRPAALSQKAPQPAVKAVAAPMLKFEPSDQEGVLYAQLLSQTQHCFERMRHEERVELGHLPELSQALIDQMVVNAPEFMRLAIADERETTLAQHGVNVAILMVQVGLELELSRGLVQDLAMVGLLHDVGMVKFEHLIRYPGPWKEGQHDHVREHPQWGQRVLLAQKALPKFVSRIAIQEHERHDGSGYPFGVTGASLDEYGQVLGLLDMYESLIHDRPFREKMVPSEAMRLLFQNHRQLFSDATFKSFLAAIPIYPVGTWVKLSTGELAKVLEHSRQNPLQPIVMVSRFDAEQASIARDTVDLSKQRGVSILGSAGAPPRSRS